MATLKVTNIVKIENTTGEDIVFTPYRQNFLYTLGNGETIEFRTNSPEQSLFYYKSILPIANVELVDSFEPSGDSYDITWNLSGIVTPSVTSIDANDEITITLEAQTGYNLPEDGDIEIVGDVTSSYESGIITLSNATSNITITAIGSEIMYSVTSNITNGTATSVGIGAINGGTVTITPESDDYDYPQSITVEPDILSNYDSTTGIATLSHASEDVTVTGTCEQVAGNPIRVVVANGSYTATAPRISVGETVTITFTPDTSYTLDEVDPGYSGPIENLSWDSSEHTLTFTGMEGTGVVSVYLPCVLETPINPIVNGNTYGSYEFNVNVGDIDEYLEIATLGDAPYGQTILSGDYSGTSIGLLTVKSIENNQNELSVIFGMSGEEKVIYRSGDGWLASEHSESGFDWTYDGTSATFSAPVQLPMTVESRFAYLNGTLFFAPISTQDSESNE